MELEDSSLCPNNWILSWDNSIESYLNVSKINCSVILPRILMDLGVTMMFSSHFLEQFEPGKIFLNNTHALCTVCLLCHNSSWNWKVGMIYYACDEFLSENVCKNLTSIVMQICSSERMWPSPTKHVLQMETTNKQRKDQEITKNDGVEEGRNEGRK
jgi:hypothetical protein